MDTNSRWQCGLLIASLIFAGCGGASVSPTAPSSGWPDVDGVYAGLATFAVPGTSTAFTCPASTVVTQADSSVSFSPIVLSGVCGETLLPLGILSIDRGGTFTPGCLSQTYADPSCGVRQSLGGGGFLDRELRLSISITSETCESINFQAVMTRGE